MNTQDRKAWLRSEIIGIGEFYQRECRLAQEPFQHELMDLEMLEPPPPIWIGLDMAKPGSERTAFMFHGDPREGLEAHGCIVFHCTPSKKPAPWWRRALDEVRYWWSYVLPV